jgi:hypothetical protein
MDVNGAEPELPGVFFVGIKDRPANNQLQKELSSEQCQKFKVERYGDGL